MVAKGVTTNPYLMQQAPALGQPTNVKDFQGRLEHAAKARDLVTFSQIKKEYDYLRAQLDLAATLKDFQGRLEHAAKA